MPRFFISAQCMIAPCADLPKGGFRITGGDARHIAFSLRMRVGDAVTVCDMQKIEYTTEIVSFLRTSAKGDEVEVILRIADSHPSNTEPSYHAVLFQAMPKAGKLDVIIQKAVETGVGEIVPFLSERCISRPDSESAQKKLTRWQKIASEAAMQCGRGIVPKICLPVSYSTAVEMASAHPLAFLCYEGDGTEPLGKLLSAHDAPESIAFLVGAEGGFSTEEVQKAQRAQLHLAGLGNRILRCETASGFVLSCLCYRYDLT